MKNFQKEVEELGLNPSFFKTTKEKNRESNISRELVRERVRSFSYGILKSLERDFKRTGIKKPPLRGKKFSEVNEKLYFFSNKFVEENGLNEDNSVYTELKKLKRNIIMELYKL